MSETVGSTELASVSRRREVFFADPPVDPLYGLSLPAAARTLTAKKKLEVLYWADILMTARPVRHSDGLYVSPQEALYLAVEYVLDPRSAPWIPGHARSYHEGVRYRAVSASSGAWAPEPSALDKYRIKKPWTLTKAVGDAWSYVFLGFAIPPFIWGLFFVPNLVLKKALLKQYVPPPTPPWVIELNGGPYLHPPRAPSGLF